MRAICLYMAAAATFVCGGGARGHHLEALEELRSSNEQASSKITSTFHAATKPLVHADLIEALGLAKHSLRQQSLPGQAKE